MQPAKNIFTSYELTAAEQLEASILPILNKANIQNKIAELAHAKVLDLKYDPEHPLKFQQEEAELQGQIRILELLINESDEAEQLVKANIVQNSKS